MSGARWRDVAAAAGRGALLAFAGLALLATATVLVAVAIGYRPVVILTGSMGETAPPGSMAVVSPRSDIRVDDVLVMRGDGRPTVTHRVIDIEENPDGVVLAVTRGDANPDRDPEPYAIGEEELVVRWVVPDLGRLLLTVRNPLIGLGLLVVVIGSLVVAALRRIWAPSPAPGAVGSFAEIADDDREPRRVSRPKQLVGATLVGASLTSAGVVFSLFVSVDSVGANVFTTSACYESQLAAVQSGRVTTTTDGITTVTVSAVDPTRAFLLFSASSASNEPDESMVAGRLVSSTEIEFVRSSDGAPVGAVDVEWSLVEYACGVSVQRGEAVGDESIQIDSPISAVEPTQTFVLGSSTSSAGSTAYDGDDSISVELIDGTTVRTASSTAIPAGSVHPWQVITFDHPNDVFVHHLAGSIAAGETTATIALSEPVDTATTLVLATTRSPNAGSAIGDRLVRARLLDESTVELSRRLTTGSVDVALQVVELGDGSTVTYGVLDLPAGTTTETATIPPVAVARSTAISTVGAAGAYGGGSTDLATDDIVGEASARVTLLDATTVEVTRDSVTAAASFAWQVVTWGGPTWADLDSPFRQRIDVTAGTVLAPDGYTTSFSVDHQALVGDGTSLASGDDLRVWRFDGSVWTELDRVLDDGSAWGATDTTLWFRTQESIAAGSTVSYWLYFGDPVPALPLDDPANVWLAIEDFDDGTPGIFEDRTGGTGWYTADPWTLRIELSVDPASVENDLADESVLVRLSDASLAAAAQPDGSDIRFTAADGVTPLSHELEHYDAASGTLTAWVRVPSVSSSLTTTFHLYAGAPNAPAQDDVRAVWADAAAVWNLATDTGGPLPALDDSGPFRRDGIALADATSVTTATGPAIDFDGALDRLESAPFVLPAGPLTVAAWFRADVTNVDSVIVTQGDPTSNGVFELAVDATVPTSPTARFRLRVNGVPIDVTGGVIGTSWHHLVGTWDGTDMRLYLDGALVGMAAAPGSLSPLSPAAVVIGADPSGSRALDGAVGQVRLDDGVWSAARIEFVAANLAAPAAVVVAGTPTAGSWFDQGAWTTRRPIAVNGDLVAGSLVDYPLLVQITDAALATQSQTDGDDLVFTADDGTTRLDHYVEAWDAATGELIAWVRVPTLDAGVETGLYLYTANATAVDQQDPAGVWGPDADLVVTGP